MKIPKIPFLMSNHPHAIPSNTIWMVTVSCEYSIPCCHNIVIRKSKRTSYVKWQNEHLNNSANLFWHTHSLMLAIAGQSTRSLTLSLFVYAFFLLLAFSFSVLHQNTINQFMVNSKILMHIYTILILSLSIRLWRQPKIQLSLSLSVERQTTHQE